MPHMDGFEATKQIRKFEKETGIPPNKSTFIVAVSGNQVDSSIDGADTFLQKPCNPAEIKKVLETMFYTSRQI